MMLLACLAVPLLCSLLVDSFSVRTAASPQHIKRRRGVTTVDSGFTSSCDGDGTNDTDHGGPTCWMHCGLLFSSSSTGLEASIPSQSFLRRGLVRSLLIEARSTVETSVAASVVVSPCNGPDMRAIAGMEQLDAAIEEIGNSDEPSIEWETKEGVEEKLSSWRLAGTPPLCDKLRVVYIPTALYALRRDSTNTPGKQRQRARADGKQRRNRLVEFLQKEIVDIPIAIVTLDLYDGSMKQCSGCREDDLPKTGYELLDKWQPHMVYVEGGNTFWLHYCMEEGGWRRLLRQYVTQPGSVYCGKSAGAILAGTNINTAYWKGWDDPLVTPTGEREQESSPLIGLDCLGQSKSVFPHMDECWQELVAQKQKTIDHPVQLLTDHDVLLVDGEKKSLRVKSSSPAPVTSNNQ